MDTIKENQDKNIFRKVSQDIGKQEATKTHTAPNYDYFPVSENHIRQRTVSTDPDRVIKYLENRNKENEKSLSPDDLLYTDIGITGTGNTDRALFVLCDILHNINMRENGTIYGKGITQKVNKYIVENTKDPSTIKTIQEEKIIISFNLIDFAKTFYNKKRVSGGMIERAFSTLKKLDESYYLHYNPDTAKLRATKYITMPEFEINTTTKNLNLTLEINPEIFEIKEGQKFAFISREYFRIYLKANNFHNQFFTRLIDIVKEHDFSKNKNKHVITKLLKSDILKVCATQPKYKKNPKYKEEDLKIAIQLAKEIGLISDIQEITATGGKEAYLITLNLRWYKHPAPATDTQGNLLPDSELIPAQKTE